MPEEDECSPVARRLKQTGELLVGGAQKQVGDYKDRFERLKGAYDSVLSKLLIHYDRQVDPAFVQKFFGKSVLSFAGVDGTVYKEGVFDLVIFFAGAYYSKGEVAVSDKGALKVTYDESYLKSGLGVSSVLPVYVNEVPVVDQTLLARDENGAIDTSSRGDSWIVDNSAFADYLMCLAEFYLAYKLVSQEKPVDILLLDRICSAELASFYAETSEFRIDLENECGLIGCKISGRPFTTAEWVYSRRIFGSLSLNTPPPRGEYLLPRVIAELLAKGPMTRQQLVDAMSLTGSIRLERLDKELEAGMRTRGAVGPLITRKGEHFSVLPQYKDLPERIEKLVQDVCGRMFSEDPSVNYEARFKIDKRWITTTDLAFLSLCCLQLMTKRCWQNKTLLIGVAKDTSARDMKRQLLPVLRYVGQMKDSLSEEGQDTPDTDRMMLQWIALREREKLLVPWASVEYDTAFKTIVPHFERQPGLVSGARRNQISLNKTFAKAYFQLSEAKSEKRLRSNVLLYDRLLYPESDTAEGSVIVLQHDYSNRPEEPEPVEVVLYRGVANPMQEFIIALFKCMTSMSIPELFGHLKPLYIADKVAKFYNGQFRTMVESASVWLTNRPELREFLFYLSSFRERRSEYEQTRRVE